MQHNLFNLFFVRKKEEKSFDLIYSMEKNINFYKDNSINKPFFESNLFIELGVTKKVRDHTF